MSPIGDTAIRKGRNESPLLGSPKTVALCISLLISASSFIMNESTADNDDSFTKSEEKESIEDKYYKLRGFAVKLKKKLHDLSEQLRVSETEKIKISADKEDLQNKLMQISENARKLQTIHSEYDKLQDDLEQEKCENKKLEKNLESLISENTSLKESLYEKKENITRLSNKNEYLSKENAKLQLILKQNQDKINVLMDEIKTELVIREQKDKEYEEMKSTLNLEIDTRKTIQAQLESFKQEYAMNNVLSLEVENYEKSIRDLQTKLNEEAMKNDSFKDTIEKHLMTIDNLSEQIVELRDTCLTKTNQITILGEKNEHIKQELCEVKRKATEHKKKMDKLIDELRDFKANTNTLNEQIETLSTENCRLLQELKYLDEAHNKKVMQLENEIVNLNIALTNSHNEMEALQAEFTGYKLRAQSVLRNKQSHNKETGSGGRSLNEIEEELEHTRTHAALLRDKLENYTQRLEYSTREISVLKEERDQAYATLNETIEKMNIHRQEFSSLMEQRRSESLKFQEMQIEHSKQIEVLQQTQKNNLSTIKEKYQIEIQNLQMEVQKYKCGSNDNVTNIYPEKQEDSVADTENHPRFSGMSILEREDGEGSESVDSYPSVAPNIEKLRKPALMPLDELLNSPDDFTTSQNSSFPNRQELEIYERRVKHLTALLSDAEKDIAKLTQLNQLLKEEIRRQQRSVEREQHANNFEYLKNVVFKFVTLKNGDERSHLIPVLNTILKLSPEETQKLNVVAGVTGKSWIPGIPIPGWNHN
ncbi:GRIP and coiled-coil domain-containing protein 2 [Cephus cinctus]|uniref:GRIP and coiled-coil domain-containing protein 2 n=1 Tax=Cephus cinctus TaxID=211228 RepID=A0AAJ7CF50_CEPCN|nr:GRIP and coiled-coil domain-containing protein 2 [Cephus cinctus]